MKSYTDLEVDISGLTDVGTEIGATGKQVKFALWRAIRRTVSRLRMMAAKGLNSKLRLRRVNLLRKRLKSIRISKGVDGYSIWIGLNDMPVSWFKGRPEQTKAGVRFRGHDFPGAFVRRSEDGRLTVLKRKGKSRLPVAEQLLPVYDRARTYIEDEVFVDVEDMIFREFMRDLSVRVKYGIGEK